MNEDQSLRVRGEMVNQCNAKSVPLTAVHMQESERLVIMFNQGDVETSWTTRYS